MNDSSHTWLSLMFIRKVAVWKRKRGEKIKIKEKCNKKMHSTEQHSYATMWTSPDPCTYRWDNASKVLFYVRIPALRTGTSWSNTHAMQSSDPYAGTLSRFFSPSLFFAILEPAFAEIFKKFSLYIYPAKKIPQFYFRFHILISCYMISVRFSDVQSWSEYNRQQAIDPFYISQEKVRRSPRNVGS